jgi:hypothetical protein
VWTLMAALMPLLLLLLEVLELVQAQVLLQLRV